MTTSRIARAIVVGLALLATCAAEAAEPTAERACLRACARNAARCIAFERTRRPRAIAECAVQRGDERRTCRLAVQRNTRVQPHLRYLRQECRPCCRTEPERCALENGGDDFWTVAPPEEAGMQSAALDGARCFAFTAGRNTQGVVIARGQRIVGEWYAPGRDASTLATSFSMAKSVSSTLIGILMDRGAIAGLDVHLEEYFPDWAGTLRATMTLHDVLAMRSGLPADDDDRLAQLFLAPDQLAHADSQPLEAAPDEEFAYSSYASMLLARIIERASGDSVASFARTALFDPIGMNAAWWTDQTGRALTYCCIDATARHFARFGLLMARGGIWDGTPVVSRNWIDRATAPIPENGGIYALQWWTDLQGLTVDRQPVPSFSAVGFDTQRIDIFPTLDLVIVRTGEYDFTSGSQRVAGTDYPHAKGPSWWDPREFAQRVIGSIVPEGGIAARSTTRVRKWYERRQSWPTSMPTKVRQLPPSRSKEG